MRSFTIMLFGSVFLFGCKEEVNQVEPERDDLISDDVVVISGEQAETVEILPNQLVFPSVDNSDLLDLQGRIVVAGPEAGNTGFLRKVLSIREEVGRIIFETENASIGDAIEQGQIQETLRMEDSRRYGAVSIDDLQTGLDLTGVVLADSEDLNIYILDGYALFNPEIELNLVWGNRNVERFTAIARGEMEFRLDVEIAARGITFQSFDFTVWESPPYIFYQSIGGFFPVVEVVTMSVHVGAEIEAEGWVRAQGGVDTSGIIAAGMEYNGGTWERVQERGFEFRAIGPNVNSNSPIATRVYTSLRVDVRFYYVSGPSISIQPYMELGLERDPPNILWDLSGGLTGVARMNVQAIILDIPIYSQRLFDVEQVVANGEIPLPGEEEEDECAGVVCNSPPSSECLEDGISMRIYYEDGECTDGECEYAFSDRECHDLVWCTVDACESGECTAIVDNDACGADKRCDIVNDCVFKGRLAFSRNVDLTRFGREHYLVVREDISSPDEEVIASIGDNNSGGLSWSPDGTKLVYSDLMLTIHTVNADGSDDRIIVDDPLMIERYPDWSPDGENILFARGHTPRLFIFNFETGISTPFFENDAVGYWSPRWSVDGSRIIVSSGSRFCIMEVDGDTFECARSEVGAEYAQILRDGRILFHAYGATDSDRDNRGIGIMESDASGYSLIVACSINECNSPSPSPDGEYFVYLRSRDVWISSLDGEEQLQLHDTPEREEYPDWSE